jgi:uncharacterized membrane protein YuzA (DUF378 family)
MKAFNIITLILCIIGGLNWGLVGMSDYNVVDAIFGSATAASRTVYLIVGLSALYQLIPLIQAFSIGEIRAEGARYHA